MEKYAAFNTSTSYLRTDGNPINLCKEHYNVENTRVVKAVSKGKNFYMTSLYRIKRNNPHAVLLNAQFEVF